MAVGQQPMWERFLNPVFRLLIDEEKWRQFYAGIDWQTDCDRRQCPGLVYPEYYKTQNFHGITGGYLNQIAATSYDPITQYLLPPHETWVRQGLINTIQGTPRRILDLGCGTGSTTLMLKQAFPTAEVIGLDLSPYMLVVANHKAKTAGLTIEWLHGNAEQTGFQDASFDLVTASLLFHETPPTVAKSILRECFRLLQPSAQVIILDGNQKILRQTPWLTEIFEEPYIKDYATNSLDAWMGATGFEAVQTQDLWLTNQITQGIKPIPVDRTKVTVNTWSSSSTIENLDSEGFPAPAF